MNTNAKPIDCASCRQPMSRDEAKFTMTGCCIRCTAKADHRQAEMDLQAEAPEVSGIRPVVGQRTQTDIDVAMLILLAEDAVVKAG